MEQKGTLSLSNDVPRETIIGQEVDRIARARMKAWMKSEGLTEGPGEIMQLNRWLRIPVGDGTYRIPDVRIPQANLIMDGTIGKKWWSTPQIKDFSTYSNGDNITIVRPTQLGGSYSILKQ